MASLQKIRLTQGKFTLVDKEDFDYLNQWKWHYGNGYAYRAVYPKGLKGIAYKVLMHRVITGCPDILQVDHANMDTLDNRRSNLRIATRSQNQWNKGLSKNNKSGHKGIVWDPVNNKWKAQVNMKEKYYNLGRYENIEDAVRVRTQFIAKKHGEFARQQ